MSKMKEGHISNFRCGSRIFFTLVKTSGSERLGGASFFLGGYDFLAYPHRPFYVSTTLRGGQSHRVKYDA